MWSYVREKKIDVRTTKNARATQMCVRDVCARYVRVVSFVCELRIVSTSFLDGGFHVYLIKMV